MKVYKWLSLFNTAKAVKKNRIPQRAWNLSVLKIARKFMK